MTSNFTHATDRTLGWHGGCGGAVYRHAVTDRITCAKCAGTLQDIAEIVHPKVPYRAPAERVLYGRDGL